MVSKIPQEFTSEWYDREYFADLEGKAFKRPNGSIEHWGYKNPEGEFLGAKEIAEAWKTMFQPESMLDVGAGRCTFIAYMRDVGIEAEGFDFSEFAIKHPYPRCKKEWLKLHDATKPWPYKDNSFDLVTALDFYEHIYTDDLSFIVNEMYRVAKKWVFLQIATIGGGSGPGIHEKGYILKKGEPIPIELEGCAVAGHVTVQDASFWYDKLDRENWLPRRDMVQWFCSLVPNNIIKNWLANTLIVMEKVAEAPAKKNVEVSSKKRKMEPEGVKISIVMPTARNENALFDLEHMSIFKPTIKSLKLQRFPHNQFEFIVADALKFKRPSLFEDNCFQNEKLDFKVKHVQVESYWLTRGMWAIAAGFNQGIAHSSGELVLRLDDCSSLMVFCGDCCKFDPEYLDKIWNWHKKGYWPMSLVVYYRGQRMAVYDEMYKKYCREMFKDYGEQDVYAYKEDSERKMKILNKMYKDKQILRDSRWEKVEQSPNGWIIAPHSWFYGYSCVPLKALLEVNGFDENFDSCKSLEDCDLGYRLAMAGYKKKFILDKRLNVVEYHHKSCNPEVLSYRGKPCKCNYALMQLSITRRRYRANTVKLTKEDLKFIREETCRYPCSHHHGEEYDLDGELWHDWVQHQHTFDLKEEWEKNR